MRHERPAGAYRGILDLVPAGWIVKRPEDHAADQGEPAFGQRRAENARVLGHEADGSQFDPVVSGVTALIEHARPGRVAGVVCEFHAP